ncbi:hypothetical protein [Dichotomicrobium thermohalophilum]|uniref:Uncharacterized protein n=1 Tax=Dichotomicrobium thermohalophilum TaxID=933063 RepID=A0A397Q890_9HYPH|nr:hypothetical protein [Dichotomicrobium thermohalophilum]RIA56045.1 hypothetical protein BXY53_1139 [Dichotomicrobium thermohalophilum]
MLNSHIFVKIGLRLTTNTPQFCENHRQDSHPACDENRCQLFSEITTEDGNTVAREFFQNLEGANEETGLIGIASLTLGLFIPSGVALDVDHDFVFRAHQVPG